MIQPTAPDPSGGGVRAEPPGHLMRVMCCAGVSLLLYLLLPHVAAMISSAQPSHACEVFPWVAKVTDDTLASAHANPTQGNLWFFLCCAALVAIYACMLRLAKGCRSLFAQSLLFGAGAVCILSLLFAPVMLSTDTFAYAFYGRVLSMHGSNPYAQNSDLTSDPFFALFNRQSLVSLYGPLWTLISACFTRFAGDRVGVTVLLFRACSALSSLGAAALIWKSLRIHAPERAAQGLVMFLWNPLVIIESGLSGHNDATMVALAMLGVWLHVKGWKTGAVVALTLSALVKFITGMLVPLYMLMVLRGMQSWRARFLFILSSGVCASVVTAAVVLPARVKSDVPAESQAMSPSFYTNNFHELVFRGLRRLLGEDAESAAVPTDFGSWWVVADQDNVLRTTPSNQGDPVAPITKGEKLIVITPTLIPWLRVYDPASHKRGYIYKYSATHIVDPGPHSPDPELEILERHSVDWPTVVTANKLIRIVTWGLFAAFGLLAAWKTTDFDEFLIWSGAALLASYFLVMTQMWPWYILWALAFGALKPGRLPARLALLLSGFVLTYYITIAYDKGTEAWVYTYRSLPAIVLPFLIFLATLVWHSKAKSQPETVA